MWKKHYFLEKKLAELNEVLSEFKNTEQILYDTYRAGYFLNPKYEVLKRRIFNMQSNIHRYLQYVNKTSNTYYRLAIRYNEYKAEII